MSAKKESSIAKGLPSKGSSWEKKVEAAWKIVRAEMPEAKDWKRIEVSCERLGYSNKLLPFTSTNSPTRNHFVKGSRSYTPIEFPSCCGIGYISGWVGFRYGVQPLEATPFSPLQQAGFVLWCDAMKRYCLYGLIISSVVEVLQPGTVPLLEYCGWKKGGGGINHVHDHRECAIWCFVVHDKKKELEKW